MDRTLFERLLLEGEGATLDFKRDPYPFAKATDEEKSELVKDIVGFANGFRRADAYVLIGVEERRGEAALVVGIPPDDPITDHSLQQFLLHLTNRPVRFQYQTFGYDGRQVGVIRIETSERPIYLKRDYGKLKKEADYIRRGSMTDPSRPASPDEIALMGSEARTPAPQLAVEFAERRNGPSLGPQTGWQAEYCDTPPPERIPDLW
jgi:predicted HTH transcriptional regulator